MIKIGDRTVGDGEACYITVEAGPTHNGVEGAKRLISHAAKSGADAVKFQIFDVDRLVADREMLFSYKILINRETGELQEKSEPLYDILKRRCLTKQEWKELKRFSDELGLAFFSTASFEEDIDLLVDINCDSIKIASGDLNNFPLLRYAAKSGLCIQIDTGSGTIGEVESAIDVIVKAGNENIIIHHCPSGYPANLENVNLRVIATLKNMFPFPIAFSDHSPGWTMDVAALGLGANLIEKTITENRMTPEVEHCFSLEPEEIRQFIETIRDVEKALGSTRRIMSDTERQDRKKVRRSAWLRSSAKSGQMLKDLDVEFRRPEDGIPPHIYDSLSDKVLHVDVDAGQRLLWSHIDG